MILVSTKYPSGEIYDKSIDSPRKFELEPNVIPSSLVCNSNHDIYILNSIDHNIYIHDLNGQYKRTIYLNQPDATNININSNGLLFVCYKTEIRIYNQSDEYIDKIKTCIPFIGINRVVFDSDNDIIVADDSGVYCITLPNYMK